MMKYLFIKCPIVWTHSDEHYVISVVTCIAVCYMYICLLPLSNFYYTQPRNASDGQMHPDMITSQTGARFADSIHALFGSTFDINPVKPVQTSSNFTDCISKRSTVWCRYNAVNFLQNYHNRHPIARPLGRVLGCLL